MEFQDLIKIKIKQRLQKIYQERKKWNASRGPFNQSSIKRRDLILFEQQILENLITKKI